MKDKKRVCIFSNLPARDRSTDEYLGSLLRDKGCEVRVTEFLPRNREHILYWKPNIIITPEPRCEYTIEFLKQCMSWGIIGITRRTEGGTCWKAWKEMEQWEKDTVVGTWPYDADLEIVWSDEFKNLVAKHGHMKRNKLFVAGGIPFDTYFLEKKPARPSGRKRIVFATGWGHADRSEEYNVPEAEPGSPIHADACKRHKEGRAKWLEMMNKMCDVLIPEGYEFFLRVKTGEYIKPYQDSLGSKIKVLVPSPAKHSLYMTDILIHAVSTMAIEAHLCNMPAFGFYGMVNQTPGYEYPHVSPYYEDIDELIKAVRSVDLDNSNADLKSIKILEKEFYGTIDGKACERIADKIASIELRPTCTPDTWPASDRKYEVPEVYSFMEQWVCECCRQTCFAKAGKEMIKCVHCGISLAKSPPQDVISNSQWQTGNVT
jgi:hypothetical protein